MVRYVLAAVFMLFITCLAFGDDPGNAKAKAKAKAAAAFALAEAEANAVKAKVNKPTALPLPEAKALSAREGKPLALWVGCKDDDSCKDCRAVRAATTECVHAIADEHDGDKTRRVILLDKSGNTVMTWKEMVPKLEDFRKELKATPKQTVAPSPAVPSGFFINAAGELCQNGI